jgi:hypothetical protein
MKRTIGYAIKNILGVRTGLFTPNEAFDQTIRTQLEKLADCAVQVHYISSKLFSKSIALQIVEEIYEILLKTSDNCAKQVCPAYQQLQTALTSRSSDIIYANCVNTTQKVKVRR